MIDATGLLEVRRVARTLWLGFESAALGELTTFSEGAVAPEVRIAALTELARWQETFGATDRALGLLDRALELSDPESIQADTLALAVDLFTTYGRIDRAVALLEQAPDDFTSHSDGLLRRINLLLARSSADADTVGEALRILNGVFTRRDCSEIELLDPDAGLGLGNLRGAGTTRQTGSSGVVTVVMPAYNAEDTIEYAIRGVLEQTWADLELIVVDDGSADRTLEIAGESGDARVQVHRNPGKGAYAARNHGLTLATGAFVTVHDADDWSHPEKIERQMSVLLADDSLVATESACARTSDELYFVEPSLKPRRHKVIPNFSSLLLHRRVFDALGPWDDAAGSADSEFVERCRRFYGAGSIRRVVPDVPLSFALRSPSSLTSASAGTGILSLQHGIGARRLYRSSYMRWHRDTDFIASLPFDPGAADRPFVRPRLLDPGEKPPGSVDVVVIADFASDVMPTVVEEIASLKAAHVRTGLVHIPSFEVERNRTRDPVPPIQFDEDAAALVDGTIVRFISAGERIDADLVVVRSHHVLAAAITGPPVVNAGSAIIVVDPPVAGLPEAKTCFERCAGAFARISQIDPSWVPLDSSVRAEIDGIGGLRQWGFEVGDVDWVGIRTDVDGLIAHPDERETTNDGAEEMTQ